MNVLLQHLALFVYLYPLVMSIIWISGGLLFFIKLEWKARNTPPGSCPPVTILMAACNEEKVIGSTVSYIFKIDYPCYEVIVVDDGSTDNTAAILREMAAAEPRLRLNRNMGKAVALNAGVRAARHEVLIPREQARLHFFTHREGELCPGSALFYFLCRDDFTIDTLACLITPETPGPIIVLFEALDGLYRGLAGALPLYGLFKVFFPWVSHNGEARRVLIVPVKIYWAGARHVPLTCRDRGGSPADQLVAPGPDAKLKEGYNIPL